jgi:hypothetical protein
MSADDESIPPPLPPPPRPSRMPSSLPHSELPVWHLQELVNGLLEEVSVLRTKQIEQAHELRQHKESLNAGNAKFSALEAKIMPRWSTIVTVISALGAMIWVASRYPDPDAFSELNKKVQQMELAGVEQRLVVDEVKKTSVRVEEKLDRLLQKP